MTDAERLLLQRLRVLVQLNMRTEMGEEVLKVTWNSHSAPTADLVRIDRIYDPDPAGSSFYLVGVGGEWFDCGGLSAYVYRRPPGTGMAWLMKRELVAVGLYSLGWLNADRRRAFYEVVFPGQPLPPIGDVLAAWALALRRESAGGEEVRIERGWTGTGRDDVEFRAMLYRAGQPFMPVGVGHSVEEARAGAAGWFQLRGLTCPAIVETDSAAGENRGG